MHGQSRRIGIFHWRARNIASAIVSDPRRKEQRPWRRSSDSTGRSTSASREKDRATIADGLSRLLADTYTLYLKTHNFHWNVKGPMFQTLHLMFETQYNELALAVDLIAERIRALGFPAPGTYSRVREALVDHGDRRRARGAAR